MEENQLYIPEGWESVGLDKLANFTTGKKDVNEGSSEGFYPFFTCSKKILKSSVYSFDKEALMIAGNGDVGTVHYYNGKFEAYQRTYILSDFKLNVQYLFQYLKSNLVKHLTEGQSGTTIQFIKINQLTDFEILKPKSTTEQKKIASILSKTDQAITQTEALIAKYNRIKTGLMQDLLTKGIDENGNIRSEETHEFKDSELGRIPKEWEVEKLGSLIYAIDPQPDHRTPAIVTDGVPYVGISDFISNGEIDIKNCRRVGFAVLDKQSKAFSIDKGDLIFGKIGTIGKPKVLPNFSNQYFTLSANVILIKPIECPEFIFWTLMSEYIDNQVSLAIHSTSQPAFGMEKIRNLDIITPKPEERILITNKISKLHELLKNEEIKLSKLQSLKTGLMQDLLTGKVRTKI